MEYLFVNEQFFIPIEWMFSQILKYPKIVKIKLTLCDILFFIHDRVMFSEMQLICFSVKVRKRITSAVLKYV